MLTSCTEGDLKALRLVAVLTAAASGYVLNWTVQAGHAWYSSYPEYRETRGTVLARRTVTYVSPGPKSTYIKGYSTEVDYDYMVGDRTFKGSGAGEAGMAVGGNYPVYYNAKNPARSVLIKDTFHGWIIAAGAVLAAGVFLFAIILFFLIQHKLRGRSVVTPAG